MIRAKLNGQWVILEATGGGDGSNVKVRVIHECAPMFELTMFVADAEELADNLRLASFAVAIDGQHQERGC